MTGIDTCFDDHQAQVNAPLDRKIAILPPYILGYEAMILNSEFSEKLWKYADTKSGFAEESTFSPIDIDAYNKASNLSSTIWLTIFEGLLNHPNDVNQWGFEELEGYYPGRKLFDSSWLETLSKELKSDTIMDNMMLQYKVMRDKYYGTKQQIEDDAAEQLTRCIKDHIN